MTRLTEPVQNLRKCARNVRHRPVPTYRQLLPPVLKDAVRGRNEIAGDGCLGDLQTVLACFRKNEFGTAPCFNEISTFHACYKKMEADVRMRKEMDSKGLIKDEEENLSRRQVNNLLKRYPQLRPAAV